MTAVLPAPTRELPNGELYYSKWGLLPFQADGVASCYVYTGEGDGGIIPVWDTGIGKSHLAMGLASYLFADDLIDLALVFCEKNKLTEWRDDFHEFTALSALRHHGTGRQQRLAKKMPHVFITTYATGRNELLRYEDNGKRSKGKKVDGPLVDALVLRDKRCLWLFDEPTALRNRSSETYKAFEYILGQLRRGPFHQRAVGLTATPLERDYEDSFNIARVICPDRMPTVAEFDERFVKERDQYRRAVFKKGREPLFAKIFQSCTIRKRKTDPDVISQFPKQVEEVISVEMTQSHADLYKVVEQLFDPPEGEDDPRSEQQIAHDEQRLFTALRLTAGHPLSHLHSDSEISTTIVETLGQEGLRRIRSSKTERLLDELERIVNGQGAQVVIFTYYANTVLREVQKAMERADFLVETYTGSKSLEANDRAKAAFKAGDAGILLCSDAGSKGMNLENAQYVIEYESATMYSKRLQRINRAHRILSDSPSVTCLTMVLEDTIEEGLLDLMLKRNREQDTLLGDEEDDTAFVSAQARARLLRSYRDRRKRAA